MAPPPLPMLGQGRRRQRARLLTRLQEGVGRPDDERIGLPQSLAVLGGVIHAKQKTAHRLEPPAPLVVGLDHGPGRPGGVGGPEHLDLGPGVGVPEVERGKVRRRQLPLPDRVDLPDGEPRPLLGPRDGEPELHQQNPVRGEHLLEQRRLDEELLVLLLGAEPHDPLDPGPVVPGPVEEDDLPRRGKVGDVALEVPLARLLPGGLVQRHHPGPTRVEPLGEPLDGAALPGGVAPLADDHDARPGLLDPALHLQQLDLEDPLAPLVLPAAQLPVVGVVLPPGANGGAVGLTQERLFGAAGVDAEPFQQGVVGLVDAGSGPVGSVLLGCALHLRPPSRLVRAAKAAPEPAGRARIGGCGRPRPGRWDTLPKRKDVRTGQMR